jgi:photosystem II stability/assembly factor-like uncharacterized protein
MPMRRVLGIVVLALATASVAWAGVGAWTATPNPRAQSIVIAPDGTIYTDTGEFGVDLARSTDHGVSWQTFAGPGQGGLSFYGTRVLAVDPAGTIYVAFNAGGNAHFVAQLFVSRDGGASWTLLLGEDSIQFLDLRIDPFAAGTLYLSGGIPGSGASGVVVAGGRLQRSTDGGTQWTFIDDTLVGYGLQGSVTAFAIDPNTPGRLYAAAVGPFGLLPPVPAFFASSDRGTTWTRSTAIPPATFTALVVDLFQPSRILGGSPSGIYRSDDSGQTFALRNALPATQFVADPLHAGSFFAATPANGVLASADGGGTWGTLNAGLTNLAVSAIALDPSGFLYAATYSAVFAYQFPDAGTLVLDAAHPFSVTLSATNPHTGQTAPGVATSVNDLWGYFSIPAITSNPNNPEVFVKMLDATAINGSFWFFYGGLTDLEYKLTVTEDATGRQKTYTKPAGSECGGSDTAAFGL